MYNNDPSTIQVKPKSFFFSLTNQHKIGLRGFLFVQHLVANSLSFGLSVKYAYIEKYWLSKPFPSSGEQKETL